MLNAKLFKLTCLFIISVLASCKPDGHSVIIKGNIKGLNAKWVYINNLFPIGSKPIDSAKVINGTFSFKFHTDTVYEPHLISVWYKNKFGKKNIFGINNPVVPNRNDDCFLIESGTIELTGNLAQSDNLSLKAGSQNDFRFKNDDLPVTSISSNAQKHKRQVNDFVEKVKDMPNAYYAMYALSSYKYRVNNVELAQMFNAFDDQTKQGYSGKKIKQFLDARPDDSAHIPNALLTDVDGKYSNMIDTTKQLNIIVFWASWCVPCKEEIPSLKKISAKFKNDNLKITSVSIDKDKTKWKQELTKQKMTWQQLAIPDKDYQHFLDQYNVNSVPRVYFIDKNRMLVKFVDGYQPKNETTFEKTITDYLKL
jgi:thiol-disulfide isomerase/thioredoxin